jgi:anaerobic ribonucleoside-triphosphate reductase
LDWKELGCFARYLKVNKDGVIKIRFRKPKELRLLFNVGSNYMTNKENRKSMSGPIHTLGGMLINWV